MPPDYPASEVWKARISTLNETLALAYGWLTLVAIIGGAEAIAAVASCIKSEIEFPSIVPFGESGFAGYDQELAEITAHVEG